jgi:hypothetical protein
MEPNKNGKDLSHEINQILGKYRIKRTRKYPKELWDKICQLIQKIGLEKACKILKLQQSYVRKKLNCQIDYPLMSSENPPMPSKAAIIELKQPISLGESPFKGMIAHVEYEGFKVKIEVQNPKEMEWGFFFEALKKNGGACL